MSNLITKNGAHGLYIIQVRFNEEDATYLIIDYKQSGIGSNSCGPELDQRYQLNEKEFSFNFYLKFL